MATLASTLIARTRRFVRDYPEYDTLGGSVSSSVTTVATTVNPASGSYAPNQVIQVDQEAMLVKTASSVAASITVLRGHMGTTAASHASGVVTMIAPNWLDLEILDELNNAIDACFPVLYQPVIDESLTVLNDTYEYTVPNMASPSTQRIPVIVSVELKDSGDTAYYEIRGRGWDVRRGATPKIVFRQVSSVGATIRVNGFGPFPHLASTADSTHSLWPYNADSAIELYAASALLAAGEARRVRADRGAIDAREQANRPGSNMAASNALYQRYLRALDAAALPPMPRHVRTGL